MIACESDADSLNKLLAMRAQKTSFVVNKFSYGVQYDFNVATT